ncbi:MAG: Calx-beta domain-containing protein, partial [Actinomycetota bacterium]
MRARLLRILRGTASSMLLVTAVVAALSWFAGPARAHTGLHDPADGTTLEIKVGQNDPGCGNAPGSLCSKFEITNCQGADTALTGYYARVNPPAGVAVRGMIVIFSGGSGTSYWQGQAEPGDEEDQRIDEFLDDLRAAGMVTIQVRWADDWLQADAGQNDGLHMACRPARIVKDFHDRLWAPVYGNPNAVGVCGFCVMGPSGGSSATAWMLTPFMVEAYVDAVFPTGGPPHAAMAKGCAPSGPAEEPYRYGTGSSVRQIDNPFRASAELECTNGNAAYRDTWDRHSIDTPQAGGDQDHPTTGVHLIDGAADPLRLHGYDWMLRMWAEPGANPYTTFEVVPGMGHGISENPGQHDGMDRLTTAILKTAAPRACDNGFDDDQDGQADTADPGCTSGTDASEKTLAATQCDNAVDDDADGLVDFRTEFGDQGCSSATDATEAGGGGDPTLSIGDLVHPEGHTGSNLAGFAITLSQASASPVTVQFSTANGTAVAPGDYTAVTGATVTFNPGEITRTANVSVNGDVLDEPDQTFTVSLSNPSGAAIADGTATGTITDDDALPVLSVGDVSVGEAVASGKASFPVTLSGQSEQPVTVAYATAPNGATSPGDYTHTSGTLMWTSGQTVPQTVDVPVVNDALDEADAEDFFLNLSSPTHAGLTDAQGIATITDNDALPALSIDDAAYPELSSGSADRAFTIKLGTVSGRAVTVSWATADGTAAAGLDYTSSGGVATIPAGSPSVNVQIPFLGDTIDETDNDATSTGNFETFTVTLSGPANATIGDGTAVGTITDDDNPPAISVGDTTVAEGDAGDTVTASFPVTLSNASDRVVTVQRATADDTALAGQDYSALASGTLMFPALDVSEPVVVGILSDDAVEPSETFTLGLSAPSANASIADGQGRGTIADDDTAPTLSVADPAPVAEGDPGDTPVVTFVVSLSAAASGEVTVGYATSSGSATEDADFTDTSGTLIFTSGQLERTVDVPVLSDGDVETDESFTFTLSSPSNATIADGSATGTIQEDDIQTSLVVSNATATEGSPAVFTITLTPAPAETVVVTYSTAPGTATGTGDFAPVLSDQATFAAGDDSKTVSVATVDDALDEPAETFFLNATTSADVSLTDPQGEATIN